MKAFYTIIAGCVSFMIAALPSGAQTAAFHKGALLVSVSEGTTWANYSTENTGTDNTNTAKIQGDRDPLFVEYGLSKHWGIGVTSGADIFNVDPSRLYGFGTAGTLIKATTSEFTVDGHYHFFITRHTDISAFASFGGFSVSMNGKESDYTYKYLSKGNIVRTGIRGRYYFAKRLGALCSLGTYAAHGSPNGVSGNTVANSYTTTLTGIALEFGLCFRFF